MQTLSFCLNEGMHHGGAFREDGTAVQVVVTRGIACELSLQLFHADGSRFSASELAGATWSLFAYRHAQLSSGVLLRSSASRVSGNALVITIANMNTVELAAYLDDFEREVLSCELCGSDSSTQADRWLFGFDLLIINRNDSSNVPQTPALYYTKSETDALLTAKISNPANGTTGQVLTKTATGEAWQSAQASGAVSSVNGKTGAVTLDAEDVGALSTDGFEVETITTGTIPGPGKIYRLEVAADTTVTFPTPVSGYDNLFELDVVMGATVYSITLPSVTWKFGVPALTAASTIYQLKFRYVNGAWEGWTAPEMSEYAKLSGGTFTGDVAIYNAGLNMACDYNSRNKCYILAGNGNVDVQKFTNLTVGYNCVQRGTWSGLIGIGLEGRMEAGFVCGKYNVQTNSGQLFTVGAGTSGNRKDAFYVTTGGDTTCTGNLTVAGELTVTVNGTAVTLASLVARIEALENA